MYSRIIYITQLVDISHKVVTEENMISYHTLIMSVRLKKMRYTRERSFLIARTKRNLPSGFSLGDTI